MMFRSLAFLLALPFTDGYATAGPSCQVFLSDGGIAEEICALRTEIGPVIGMTINGSTFETGDFEDTYQIMELPADGSITADDILSMSVNYTEYLTDLIIEVTRFGAGGCEVLLNGEACAACEVCGENTTEISVDCSVVTSGRAVACEPVGNIFFPLEGYTFAEGEVSDNPPSTTDGEVSDNPPSAEGSEESASPQHSMVSFFIAGCMVASATFLQL